MNVVTVEEMRRIDEATINVFVTGIALMERAGQRIYEHIAGTFPPAGKLTVSIFLGRGNNAGDGLVVARLLAEEGAKVHLLYLHSPEEFSPDAAKNHARLVNLREGRRIVEHFLHLSQWESHVETALAESDVIVDALLGTGLSKPVAESYEAAIEAMNSSDVPIVAVDIPSGVNGNTGEIMGAAVRADVTVTMGLPKLGLLFHPGKACAGELVVSDIGIPKEVVEKEAPSLWLIDFEQALEDLPPIDPASHKFARGSLLVVAGSRRYAGAAVLTSVSALRTGCGIVYLAGPESIRTVVQTAAPEIVFISLPETQSGAIAGGDVGALLGGIRFDAAAIGHGMTTEEETSRFVRELASLSPKPLVIDADGINAFAGRLGEIAAASRGREIIVSPHAGELARLAGAAPPERPLERIAFLRSLVAGTGLSIVHKGAPTIVVHPDGRGDINALGHPGQATAGSGDVLTGAIAGFLAQGCGRERAARLGVYLHSRAAELAALEVGERGMIAGDCMRSLPMALCELA